MELFLEYYYALKPLEIEVEKDKIKIQTKKKTYDLFEVKNESFLYNSWIQKDKRYHQIIPNQFQQMISSYQGKNYVLCIPSQEKINIFFRFTVFVNYIKPAVCTDIKIIAVKAYRV